MKKFQFNLKALLSYREHLEQIAKQDLAKVLGEINAVNDFIAECQSLRETTLEELQIRSETGISALDMSRYMDYMAGLEQKTMEAQNHLQHLTQLANRKRTILAEKSVGKKAILNLKEKRKKEYVDEVEKFLQKQSDEMVLISGTFVKQKEGAI
ncbi:MAG: flagellar export protein FliJ [Proteobacteria bacterium]|nr:flagellar export protein FliJ [Pseudomonadota bacterium]